MKCPKCQNGVTGLVGHVDLFILRLDGATMQFKCARCETLWTRTTSVRGNLAWSSTAPEMKGMAVPGWKARQPAGY